MKYKDKIEVIVIGMTTNRGKYPDKLETGIFLKGDGPEGFYYKEESNGDVKRAIVANLVSVNNKGVND